MTKMLDFYESLCRAAGLTVTSDGCVSIKTSKEPKPLTLKGKRLVLPTKEHLANPDREHRIIFHPLTENVMRGESEVFERFRMAINGRLNVVIGTIMQVLLQVGTSHADQQKLTPEQSEFLLKVKNADEKTLNALTKIVDSVTGAQANKLYVTTFIKRGGQVGDKRFSRVGVASFPFYNELKKGESEVHGVKLRVKDREALIGLLDYILPDQDVVGAYNQGSNSNIAPTLEALMRTVRGIAAPLNDIIDRFSGILPDNLLIDADWVETLDNLDALLPEIRSVPMQAGNEGIVPGQEGAASAAAAPATSGPSVSQAGGAGTTFAAQRPAATWGQQQPQQQQAVAPAATKTASGGTDFEALVRGNPRLQQAVGFGGTHGWNPGASFSQAPQQQQRASLSNPVGPVGNTSWGGGNSWSGQQQGWSGQSSGWGNSNIRL